MSSCGELSLLCTALTDLPPKDSMAAKRMTLVGCVALLTSANLCSHLSRDLAFYYIYGCCDRSVEVIKRRKILPVRKRMKLETHS